MHIINSTQIMLLISHRNVIENHVLVSLKKLLKKICLQDAIYLKNNELVTFKISCKPDFKGKFDVCGKVFASPFSILNNPQLICTFHIFDMN